MSDIESFEKQIRQKLKSVEERNRAQQLEMQARMAEIEQRHLRFDRIAAKLMAEIVEPRMEKLAGCFENAEQIQLNQTGKHFAVCRFNHSARFPASVKLTLSVAHDAEVQNILFVYDLEILPIFMKFDAHDQTAVPLDHHEDGKIASSVQSSCSARWKA